MVELSVHHRTAYRYRQPVGFGPHRLMLRPRESRDLRLVSSRLTVTPEATVSWTHDVAGNTVAIANFVTPAEELVIDGAARVELSATAYPVFDIAASANAFPFRYSDDEWTDLGALTRQQYPGGDDLRAWAQGFVASYPTDTLSLLKDI